ncbi:hypothetical protein VTK56DRAFT_289 [Thermocarpiscus australiensis]
MDPSSRKEKKGAMCPDLVAHRPISGSSREQNPRNHDVFDAPITTSYKAECERPGEESPTCPRTDIIAGRY